MLLAASPLLPLVVLWNSCGLRGCPDVDLLRTYQPGGAPQVVDRNGERIGELALADHVVVKLADLPAHVPEAFVAVEDKRFHQHRGVDAVRLGGALLANVRARSFEQGASTLTMQLARTLFPQRIPGRDKTLRRKLLELRVARAIEAEYDKDEILELYLNHVYFGNGKRGIESAARHHFGRRAADLTLAQTALLAALPKAPSHYDPRRHPEQSRARRDLVLALMAEQGRITATAAAAAQDRSLGVRRRAGAGADEEPFAGYFLDQVRAELEKRFGDRLYRERVRVVTTLDAAAQRDVEAELAAQLAAIESGALGAFRGPRHAAASAGDENGTDYLQGAAILMDAADGDVLAWVGGRDYRDSGFDRAALAHRQLGSLMKPFVYAAALAAGVPTTQQLSDLPVRVTLAGGRFWEPRNFGDSYLPMVTMRQALVESRNAATVQLAAKVGLDGIRELARDVGLPRVSDQPAMVLGADAASPLELTLAYAPFATLGSRPEPRLVLRLLDEDGEVLWEADQSRRRQVLDPAVAYVVTDMLRGALRTGTGSAAYRAGLEVPAAGKTGTTNAGHDAWFVGYTPELVGTIWIGFDRPRSIVPRTSGGTLAAPVWGRVVRDLYRRRSNPKGWAPPDGVVFAQVDGATFEVIATGCPAPSGVSYTEVFLADAVPRAVCRGEQLGVWARLRDLWTPPDEVAAARRQREREREGWHGRVLRERGEREADQRRRERIREERERIREERERMRERPREREEGDDDDDG